MRHRAKLIVLACLALGPSLAPRAVSAQFALGSASEGGTDEDQLGFAPFGAGEDPEATSEGESVGTPAERPGGAMTNRSLGIEGFIGSELALRTRHGDLEPLAKARQVVELSLDYGRGGFRMRLGVHGAYDLAYLDGEPAVERDAYEWLVRPAESFLRWANTRFEIETGALLHAPGTMQLLDVLDVLSPRDLREPGLLEPSAARLPVFSTRLALLFGRHRVEAGVIHQAWWGLRPGPLGEFSVLREVIIDYLGVAGTPLEDALLAADVRYDDDVLGVSRHSQQPYARARFEGSRASTELLYGHLRDRVGVIGAPGAIDLGAPSIELPVAHPYYDLVGLSGEAVVGDWVLAYEAMAEWRRPIATTDPSSPQGPILDERLNLFSAALGVRYEGFLGATIGAEYRRASFGWREEHETPLLPYDVPAAALYYRHSLSRDRVVLEAALLLFGDRFDAGALARGYIAYRPMDTLQLGIGYVHYHEGPEYGPLRGFGSSDRLFADLRWDFARAL